MKKIIAVMVAFMFAAIAFNINVSAVDVSDMTSEEYELYMEHKRGVEIEYLKALENYENGNISYDEFVIQSDEIISRYNELNSDDNGVVNSIAQNVSNTIQGVTTGIGNAVSNGVSNISDIISDALNPHQETVSVSDFNLNGYGAALKTIAHPGGSLHTGYIRYFSYGVIIVNSDGSLTYSLKIGDGNMRSDEYYYYYTKFNRTTYSSNNLAIDGDNVDSIYGDWRYADGTPAPTNDIYTDMNVYNFDNATNSELDKTLQDLNETLKTLDPDLSTMEGLLESIYFRLGKLDSDNDNALLSDINIAIMTLMQENSSENAELVSILLEIRDELKNESNDTSNEDSDGTEEETENGHPDHICGTLYNVKPLDKNWLNKLFTDTTELKVEYQSEKYYLESCGCLKLSINGEDKYYSVDMNYDSYTNIDYDFNSTDVEISTDITSFNYIDMDLSDSQKKKIDNIVEMVGTLISKGVPMSAINGGLTFYQDIIFNSSDPKDIIFELSFNGETYNFTILSTNFFNAEAKQALLIVKNFVSIIICYAWLLTMRRKASGMMG